MKKLKHVQLFEAFQGGQFNPDATLPPADIATGSDYLVYGINSEDIAAFVGLVSKEQAEMIVDQYMESEDYDGYKYVEMSRAKPGQAYVSIITPGDEILYVQEEKYLGVEDQDITKFFAGWGGFGTDLGYRDGFDVWEKIDFESYPGWDKYSQVTGVTPEGFSNTVNPIGGPYGDMIVTLKRGYITIKGGIHSKGYDYSAETIPAEEIFSHF
jgi:hypothetical protein